MDELQNNWCRNLGVVINSRMVASGRVGVVRAGNVCLCIYSILYGTSTFPQYRVYRITRISTKNFTLLRHIKTLLSHLVLRHTVKISSLRNKGSVKLSFAAEFCQTEVDIFTSITNTLLQDKAKIRTKNMYIPIFCISVYN